MKKKPVSFSVDEESKKVRVDREFAAPLKTVWDAWTTQTLDKWWAPKPWRAVTVSMDFRVGGYWLYYMLGPNGEKHYSRADYQSIEVGESYSARDAFCDDDGDVKADFPQSTWTNSFEDKGDSTIVHVEIAFDEFKDLEQTLLMGFEEGFKMGMENLDELLTQDV